MKLLTRLGLVITTIWTTVIAIIIWLKWDSALSMELNAWGDFLAGLSAPLALLWLVVGYFQQGEELRLNTTALEAQQEELKRQVEKTALLAENSERQAAASETLAMLNKAEAEREELRRRLDAQPEFLAAGGSVSGRIIQSKILNRGGEIYDVSVEYVGTHQLSLPPLRVWESGREAPIHITQKEGERLEWPIEFSITYRDSLGEEHTRHFKFTKPHELEEATN